MERMKNHAGGTQAALRAVFDRMYDGLIECNTTFSELEDIMEKVYGERTAPIEALTAPEVPSILEVEEIMVSIRDFEERRKRIANMLNMV